MDLAGWRFLFWMATTRAHTATVHTPIFKHAPSHRTDIYLSVQWRQFIHAYPQDKLASLKVMLFLTTTNRQIVEDTSIAQKDFKVPCQVIFLNISLPVRQKLWAHRTISGNKISSFCCAARISLDSRFSFPLINIFNLAFYRNWFLKKNAVSSLFTFIPPTSPSPRLDLVRW